MSQLDLYRRITELEAENERLRAKLAAAETYGEKERGHFEDWFKRACEAEARIRALEAALREIAEAHPSHTAPWMRDIAYYALTEPPPPKEEQG